VKLENGAKAQRYRSGYGVGVTAEAFWIYVARQTGIR
jgi:hypothetical protein